MTKVLLITEYLNPPYDEGIKKTVYNLYSDLENRYELLVISRYAIAKANIKITNTNPLFISFKIRKRIQEFQPDTLIYFPFASGTFAGYLRMKVLSLYAPRANKILIALQPKSLKKWQQFLIRFIKPDFAITPSPGLKNFWDSIHVANQLFPLFTDTSIFKPLEKQEKKIELRKKYNLPINKVIISHMGHLNEGRNLKSLIPLQKEGSQLLIIGSSSTPQDSIGPNSLKSDLQKEGIIIIDNYIEHIEEIYQLSDIYIFPVVAKTGSIGMPLSVLEARACAIPVISTYYGSLESFLGDDHKGIYYSKPENFSNAVLKIEKSAKKNFSKTQIESINQTFFTIIRSCIENST